MLISQHGCVQRFQFRCTNTDTTLLFQIYLSILNNYVKLTDVEQEREEKNIVREVVVAKRLTLHRCILREPKSFFNSISALTKLPLRSVGTQTPSQSDSQTPTLWALGDLICGLDLALQASLFPNSLNKGQHSDQQ